MGIIRIILAYSCYREICLIIVAQYFSYRIFITEILPGNRYGQNDGPGNLQGCPRIAIEKGY